MIKILNRKVKANFTIRVMDNKKGSYKTISIYSEKDNVDSIKQKIEEALVK